MLLNTFYEIFNKVLEIFVYNYEKIFYIFQNIDLLSRTQFMTCHINILVITKRNVSTFAFYYQTTCCECLNKNYRTHKIRRKCKYIYVEKERKNISVMLVFILRLSRPIFIIAYIEDLKFLLFNTCKLKSYFKYMFIFNGNTNKNIKCIIYLL